MNCADVNQNFLFLIAKNLCQFHKLHCSEVILSRVLYRHTYVHVMFFCKNLEFKKLAF